MSNTTRRILVVSEYVHAAENSTGYFWSKIIQRLGSAAEHPVHVLTPSRSVQERSKSPAAGVQYHPFYTPPFQKNALASRLYGQLAQSVGFLRLLFRTAARGDVILSGTNPALLLMILPWVRMLKGVRWAVLVHDVYPDNLVPAGILRSNGVIFFVLSRYFGWVYRSADLMFVIGRDMQIVMAEKIGRHCNIHYVPNWVDDADVEPIEKGKSEVITALGWEGKIVFQFFGNLGRVQGIDNLLAAIKLVRHPRAAFLFIGDGVKTVDVKLAACSRVGPPVAYIGPIDQSKKAQGLAACDVAVVTLAKGMMGLGVPSKAYFSMAADRPLLAVMEPDAEVALAVREHKIGWVCPPNEPTRLARMIEQICDELPHAKSPSPRQIFCEHYSERALLDAFMGKLSGEYQAR